MLFKCKNDNVYVQYIFGFGLGVSRVRWLALLRLSVIDNQVSLAIYVKKDFVLKKIIDY